MNASPANLDLFLFWFCSLHSLEIARTEKPLFYHSTRWGFESGRLRSARPCRWSCPTFVPRLSRSLVGQITCSLSTVYSGFSRCPTKIRKKMFHVVSVVFQVPLIDVTNVYSTCCGHFVALFHKFQKQFRHLSSWKNLILHDACLQRLGVVIL